MSIFKKIAGGAIGSALGGIAMGPAGSLLGGAFGASNSDGLTDLLMGKKQGSFKADQIAGQIRGAQAQGIATAQKGLGELNSAIDAGGGAALMRKQLADTQTGIVSSAEDARRRAQQLMAQRGLAGSSLGLSADRSITQEAGKQNAAAVAALPGAIRNQAIQDAQMRMSGGQGLFAGLGGGSGIRFHNEAGQRSGGILGVAGALAPVAGTALGLMAGGRPGAAAGNAAGQSVAQAPMASIYANSMNRTA